MYKLGSMVVIDKLKPLFASSRFFLPASTSSSSTSSAAIKAERKKLLKHKGGLKIGQGGTLDPLADGVLVLGIGKGTKYLQQFLDCTKVSRFTWSLPYNKLIEAVLGRHILQSVY